MTQAKAKMLVGALEYCDLPELGLEKLAARVDTGAALSSLHVDNLQEYKEGGKTWVSFDIHPDIHQVDKVVTVRTRVRGRKQIKSSSADLEKRLVIVTTLRLGESAWPIKLTLTNRANMRYLMLLGREAMGERLWVDPSRDYLLGQPDQPD